VSVVTTDIQEFSGALIQSLDHYEVASLLLVARVLSMFILNSL
jgi:hypothetical protein